MKRLAAYILAIATSVSQSANAFLLWGDPDETISGRAYRRGTLEESRFWKVLGNIINVFFFFQKNHVKSSYLADIRRVKKVLRKHKKQGKD